MQKFLWSCQLFSTILSRPTNTIKTHHSPYKKRKYPLDGEKRQEEAFQEVKHRISRPPVLHLPRAIDRLVLFSDTSKVGTGSSLWQDGKPCLIGYASKTLPEACSRYSVTELEMTGLLVNMGLWKNILKHREFDAAVDHVCSDTDFEGQN